MEEGKQFLWDFWEKVFKDADESLLEKGLAWKCECSRINWFGGVWENECSCGKVRMEEVR